MAEALVQMKLVLPRLILFNHQLTANAIISIKHCWTWASKNRPDRNHRGQSVRLGAKFSMKIWNTKSKTESLLLFSARFIHYALASASRRECNHAAVRVGNNFSVWQFRNDGISVMMPVNKQSGRAL